MAPPGSWRASLLCRTDPADEPPGARPCLLHDAVLGAPVERVDDGGSAAGEAVVIDMRVSLPVGRRSAACVGKRAPTSTPSAARSQSL